jgi:hypothetical protein
MRNDLAAEMIQLLNGAAFEGQPINGARANDLIDRGNARIAKVQQLAGP